MGRSVKRLSAMRVKAETRKGRYADGDGLYLQVTKNGTKSWIFRFMLAGKARQMGLGSERFTPLSEARERAYKCRRLLAEGLDPIEERRKVRARRASDAKKSITFSQAFESYLNAQEVAWKNAKHRQQWRSTIETYAYPFIGDLPVSDVQTEEVRSILEPIWRHKTETASRVRGRIERVLDWAKACGYRDGENPARWRGHLKNVLPPPESVRKERHHNALDYNELGPFWLDLRTREGPAALGLEFLILTACRTSEVTGARWDEIKSDVRAWEIPADRMKGGKEHRVPLTDAALDVLERADRLRESEFIFPGGRSGSALSSNAFRALLKRMGRADITAHGFRSTFRDWAADLTVHQREVIELALAHGIKDDTERAYWRSDLFVKRRQLMDEWAAFCEGKGQ